MKKILLLLCAVTLLVACNDDPDDAYVFDSILYTLQKGDGQTTIENYMLYQPLTYVNDSPVTKEFRFIPGDRSIETSWFEIDRADLGLIAANAPIWVQTPVAVINGNIKLGNVEWEYTKDMIEWYEAEESTVSLPVGPYQRITIFEEGFLDEITVSYTAFFINPDTGDERQIRGKWMGSYYLRTHIRCEYSSVLTH
ncbi:MAG: hypothetical protein LUF04_03510 [Bacteroides sp.]|nr:hypothetical protein [Bacteroides sp.]MCD8079495.1 hypothetical protein [Bacteroides sp.]